MVVDIYLFDLNPGFKVRFFDFLFLLFLITAFSCGPNSTKSESSGSSDTKSADLQVLSGAALAEMFCTGCHLLPEPGKLDKKTWEKIILPRMGHYYGIYAADTTRES